MSEKRRRWRVGGGREEDMSNKSDEETWDGIFDVERKTFCGLGLKLLLKGERQTRQLDRGYRLCFSDELGTSEVCVSLLIIQFHGNYLNPSL